MNNFIKEIEERKKIDKKIYSGKTVNPYFAIQKRRKELIQQCNKNKTTSKQKSSSKEESDSDNDDVFLFPTSSQIGSNNNNSSSDSLTHRNATPVAADSCKPETSGQESIATTPGAVAKSSPFTPMTQVSTRIANISFETNGLRRFETNTNDDSNDNNNKMLEISCNAMKIDDNSADLERKIAVLNDEYRALMFDENDIKFCQTSGKNDEKSELVGMNYGINLELEVSINKDKNCFDSKFSNHSKMNYMTHYWSSQDALNQYLKSSDFKLVVKQTCEQFEHCEEYLGSDKLPFESRLASVALGKQNENVIKKELIFCLNRTIDHNFGTSISNNNNNNSINSNSNIREYSVHSMWCHKYRPLKSDQVTLHFVVCFCFALKTSLVCLLDCGFLIR